jgi:hypothetical protein
MLMIFGFVRGGSSGVLKISEFFTTSPLSGAEKHLNFQVTSCHYFVTTNVDFACIKSE